MISTKKCLGLAALAMMLGSASPASAVPVLLQSDFDSFGGEPTELTGTGPESLRVDLFNPALGTLGRVVVTLHGSMTSGGSVKSTAATEDDITAELIIKSFKGTLSGGAPAALGSTVNIFATNSVIARDTFLGIDPGETRAFPESGASPCTAANDLDLNECIGRDSGIMTLLDTTNAATLAQFIDSVGPIDEFGYDLTSLIQFAVTGGGGNMTGSITTFAGGDLQVQYWSAESFEAGPVPEPATLSLLGGGLLTAAWRARRRKDALKAQQA